MKRESILMLVAGILFGAVAGFILTREHYEKKLAGAAPQDQVQPPAAGMPGGTPPQFDPDQHNSMIQQFVEQAKQPGNLPAKVTLGNIYYDRGNWAEAAVWYEQALALNDKDANVHVDLGVCFKNMNRPQDAITQFDRALAVEKDKKEALFNKVVVFSFDLKDKAKARAALDALKAAHGSDPKVQQLEAEIKKGA